MPRPMAPAIVAQSLRARNGRVWSKTYSDNQGSSPGRARRYGGTRLNAFRRSLRSRLSSTAQSIGTDSHLWASRVSESARSSPV